MPPRQDFKRQGLNLAQGGTASQPPPVEGLKLFLDDLKRWDQCRKYDCQCEW